MKKFWLMALAAVLAWGCGEDEKDKAAASAAGKYTIGVSVPAASVGCSLASVCFASGVHAQSSSVSISKHAIAFFIEILLLISPKALRGFSV